MSRHLELGRHLLDEIFGRCDYDESFLWRAKESKVLEGLGEAAPQMLLQCYFVVRLSLNSKPGLGGEENVLFQIFKAQCKSYRIGHIKNK